MILNYDKQYEIDEFATLTLEYEKFDQYKGIWLFVNAGDDIDASVKAPWTCFSDNKTEGDWQYTGKIVVDFSKVEALKGKTISAVGIRGWYKDADTEDTIKVTKCYLTKK